MKTNYSKPYHFIQVNKLYIRLIPSAKKSSTNVELITTHFNVLIMVKDVHIICNHFMLKLFLNCQLIYP